jgi:hypothetical protein
LIADHFKVINGGWGDLLNVMTGDAKSFTAIIEKRGVSKLDTVERYMSVCIYRSQGWPVEHFFFRSLQPVYCIKCGTLKMVMDHSIYIYLRMDLFFFYVLLPWLWFINDVNRKKLINYKREKDKWERKLTHKMKKK